MVIVPIGTKMASLKARNRLSLRANETKLQKKRTEIEHSFGNSSPSSKTRMLCIYFIRSAQIVDMPSRAHSS